MFLKQYALQATCSSEGFRYVVGYVQQKAKKKFPNMGLPGGIPKGWLQLLSRGGLTHPNEALVNLCEKLEAVFVDFHGTDINREPNPMERLMAKCMTQLNLPLDKKTVYIVKLYLKLRFFNRIKWLNTQQRLSESKEKIRSGKQHLQHIF